MGDNHRTRGGPDRDVVPGRPCRTACTCDSPPAPMPTASSYTPVLIDRALLRATGSPRIDGNAVRLLRDAGENYPAWLAAIAGARRTILFESYLVADDAVGRAFVGALAASARAGVAVRVVDDWLGCSDRSDTMGGAAERRRARSARSTRSGFDSPLGWLSRDHRKTIVIDGRIAFVTGVCVSARGPATHRGLEPWRDTGIEMRGPGRRGAGAAFAQVWDACGEPRSQRRTLRRRRRSRRRARSRCASSPACRTRPACSAWTSSIASAARQYLWLTDAYFVGRRPTCRRCGPPPATASTCACWCRARATFRRCNRYRGQGIDRCSRRASACSSGTARCCTRRPRSPTALGARRLDQPQYRQLDPATGSSTSRSRTPASPPDGRDVRATTCATRPKIVLTRRNRVRTAEEAPASARSAAPPPAARGGRPPARCRSATRWARR